MINYFGVMIWKDKKYKENCLRSITQADFLYEKNYLSAPGAAKSAILNRAGKGTSPDEGNCREIVAEWCIYLAALLC